MKPDWLREEKRAERQSRGKSTGAIGIGALERARRTSIACSWASSHVKLVVLFVLGDRLYSMLGVRCNTRVMITSSLWGGGKGIVKGHPELGWRRAGGDLPIVVVMCGLKVLACNRYRNDVLPTWEFPTNSTL